MLYTLGCTDIHFLQTGVKVNGEYYCNVCSADLWWYSHVLLWHYHRHHRPVPTTCHHEAAHNWKDLFLRLICCQQHALVSGEKDERQSIMNSHTTDVEAVTVEVLRPPVLCIMLLPDIWRVSGDCYIFQQASVPAHWTHAIMEFLERETPEFISLPLWSPNSPDLNLVDYIMWRILYCKRRCTKHASLILTTSNIASESEPSGQAVSRHHCCSFVSVASPSFSLCQGGQWSFWALLLILTLCFCNNCGVWSLHWLVESHCCKLIFRSDFLAIISCNVVAF